MHPALIAHVVFGLLFIFAVLIQDKGTGLSAAFGGSGGFYASQRGAAKVMHYLSIVFCIGFFLSALLYVVIPAPAPAVNTPPVSATTTEGAPVNVETVPAQ